MGRSTVWVRGLLAAAGIAALAPGAASAAAVGRVSVGRGGAEADNASVAPAVSRDGRYVAFWSYASNLAGRDRNGAETPDVYVRDRAAGTTTRVSVSSAGVQSQPCAATEDDSLAAPAISADGRDVAFSSSACNLVAGDTNQAADVFVRDRWRGVTTRVSVGARGAQGDGDSVQPAIAADGRSVAFASTAANLVAHDANGLADVFVRDRAANRTIRVSVDRAGGSAGGSSQAPAISGDGRVVAFESSAANLVRGDTNGDYDVFARDLRTSTTTRVSRSGSGAQANPGGSFDPAVSRDGRIVAFASLASNLVAGDTNGVGDVFVHDRAAGSTARASVSAAGHQPDGDSFGPALSADGRYVAFASSASDLVTGDTNGEADVYVREWRERRTERVSVSGAGAQAAGGSFDAALSADGRIVAFDSFAADLVGGDANAAYDVFARDGGPVRP